MTANILFHASDIMLHAHVDGELPPEQRRRLVAELRHRPEAAARAVELLAQSQALRDAYDCYLHDPLPGATKHLSRRLSGSASV